jgi:hypothetical protein
MGDPWMQPSLEVRRCKRGLQSARRLQPTAQRIRYCSHSLPESYSLRMEAVFLLLKARFFEVKQDLKAPEHTITDGAAVS